MVATLLDLQEETEGISLTEANSAYKYERNFGVIGYDTEFMPTDDLKEGEEPELLSHQFCFDTGTSRRYGVVLDTGLRFTDENLLKFLGSVVTSDQGYLIKEYHIVAHFSLVEGSWVDSSKKKLIERQQKEWKGKQVLASKNKLLKDKKTKSLRTNKKTGKKEPVKENIWISFADTMNLDSRSLQAAAETCGLEKYAVLPMEYKDKPWFKKSCERVYKSINKLRTRRPNVFYRYGMRDSIVGAGIPIVLHSKFGTGSKFQLRAAKYSETHMAEWFRENYKGIHDGWQRVLGQQKISFPSKKPGAKDYVKWEPDRLQKEILQEWYKGGRNEARQIGCFDEPLSYFDMTSAYPTSLAALACDYDFSTPIIRTRNDGAKERVKQLMSKGPFQPHGIKAYIRFKDDCKVPMAPISTESGIIYPLETEGQVICWPEYWTAKKLKIIKEEFILSFYEFRALESRKLPDYVLEMLRRRKEEKIFFKSILNFLSGKFAQGRRKNIPYSTISCPALAAYITSTTRAAAAEIGNLNDYHAITTDGIISPVKDKPRFGDLNSRLEERLIPTGFEWLKKEFTGVGVIWKTRGYILFDRTVDPIKEPDRERFKQAKMGLQGEEPADIINQIKTGKGVRKSAKTFAKLDDGEVFSFLAKEFDVNPSFDFKYAIDGTVQDKSIEIDGVELTMPCFSTRPLRNINEYNTLRRISYWKTIDNLRKKDKKELLAEDLESLILTATLNDGRCRHMVWEFKKRLARTVDVKETTLHANTHRSWKEKPLYKIPAIYGSLKGFLPILLKEVEVVKDESQRAKIFAEVLRWMNKDIEREKKKPGV